MMYANNLAGVAQHNPAELQAGLHSTTTAIASNWKQVRSWNAASDNVAAARPDLWLKNFSEPAWVDSTLAFWELEVETFSQQCEQAELADAVAALDLVVQRGSHVEDSVFDHVLTRCIAQKDLVLGRRVHTLAYKSGYRASPFLANRIIRMYASHGRLEEARQVFAMVDAPNCYMWASIILAHAEHGKPELAIELYQQIRHSTVRPNSYIFVAVLKACATSSNLSFGKEVHADVVRIAGEPDLFVGNCLVDMYSKCGSLENARELFNNLTSRDVVTWNSLITGYTQNGLGQEALALYELMQKEGITPASRVTFVCLLQACASVGALHQGKQLHSQIDHTGLETDLVVGNCLIDMYAKCGSLEDARRVFDRLPRRDVVTWTAMVGGYAKHGLGKEALSLYSEMQDEGIIPVSQTFVCLLQACASVGALHVGKQLHARIQENGLEADVVVGSCLVDLYAKCGRLEDARRVFDRLPTRNVVTWTAMLNAYAEHGTGEDAIQCFEEMQMQGIKPDKNTFSCLLVACSHAGLVQKGQMYFKMMLEGTDVPPDVYHFTCMVDLLARSGHLDEAESMLQISPFKNHAVGWISLLSACKSHGDAERGKRCFDQIIDLDPQNGSAYVLLENIYANAGMQREVGEIESFRKSAGAWKKPGKACIEVKSKVHEFTVGDKRSDISSKVRSMKLSLKDGGHLPQTELVLKPVSELEKEDLLCGHAEKLALAYGLLNTPHGEMLIVTKNLRMCNDCHSSTKTMSLVEKREIIVRDAHCVHRFLDGYCSCLDRH